MTIRLFLVIILLTTEFDLNSAQFDWIQQLFQPTNYFDNSTKLSTNQQLNQCRQSGQRKLVQHYVKIYPRSSNQLIKTNCSTNVTIDELLEIFKKFSQPRSYVQESYKNELRLTLKTNLIALGFDIIEQTFAHNNDNLEPATINGVNLIAVWPGKFRNTPNDSILLLGAHYDTTSISPGVDDDGSGCVWISQLAKMLSSCHRFFDYSIYLAFFDNEEFELSGSSVFVQQYLIPIDLMKRKAKFIGALMGDMLLIYNSENETQTITSMFNEANATVTNTIYNQGRPGNFYSIWIRREVDQQLASNFSVSWNKMINQQPYQYHFFDPLITVKDNFNRIVKSRLSGFLRSDHSSFWFHGCPSYNGTLSALLINDLGPWRRGIARCYHQSCDNENFLTPKNLNFLAHLIRTTYHLITVQLPSQLF